MKYEELKNFILNEMKMENGHNYQPVMIRALIQNDGKATQDKIQNAVLRVIWKSGLRGKKESRVWFKKVHYSPLQRM